MNIQEFKEGIELLQNNYHKKLSKEELNLFYDSLKNMTKDDYLNNIKKHIENNKYMPSIAELKQEEISDTNIDRINLNSSYWYINLREWCDENNEPYYDITTGKPLPAYK